MNTNRALLRAEDVAPLLGVSKARVYQLISEGLIPHIKMGAAVVIPRPAWDEWLRGLTQEALANVSHGQPKPEPEAKIAAKIEKRRKVRKDKKVAAGMEIEAKRGPSGPIVTRLERGVSRREME